MLACLFITELLLLYMELDINLRRLLCLKTKMYKSYLAAGLGHAFCTIVSNSNNPFFLIKSMSKGNDEKNDNSFLGNQSLKGRGKNLYSYLYSSRNMFP